MEEKNKNIHKIYATLGASNHSKSERVENDYYATPYESTRALLDIEKFEGDFIEPCVGGGHIVEILKEYYPNSKIIGVDLVDRGYKDTIVSNYFDYTFNGDFNVVTNPPYSLAQEFLEHSMEQIQEGKKVAMFLKIQFLEGNKRKELFKKYPPKIIHVFSKRQNPWRNGSNVDEKGKPWSSTMCFAWFVWEKGYKGQPIINWI